jgi:hypothetical protein
MKMTFTPTTVNNWFFTIDGLSAANGNDQPVPQPFLGQYVTELNPVPPATTPVATPAEIQANLENFPFNPGTPPPTNLVTDTFYRTTVADFVLREFQLAWGMVPTSGAATSQYDAWVARVIDNPANMTAGGMSMALAGTPNFTLAIGAVSATQPATIGMINALAANAGVAVGAGAQALVGLPVWQVLQTFATSTLVTNAMAAPIANFQNLLLAGGTAPAGNLLTLPGSPGANLTLTTGVDTPTTGFSGGHGAQATTAGAVFLAAAGSNIIGLSNTLNAGDNLVATGAALGNSTLNYTAVAPAAALGNPADAVGVTMTGVNAAIITNLAGVAAGFSGTITGLTSATVGAGSTALVHLGTPGNGLNTALTNVTINASAGFTADQTAAALAAAPTATVTLNGPVTTTVTLGSGGSTTGYSAMTVDSTGPGGTTANTLGLETPTATNTATLTVTGAEFLNLHGSVLNIDNLHTFTGAGAATPPPAADTGGFDVVFNETAAGGHVAATGGSGVNTFEFGLAPGGTPSFTSASTVNGGTGATNTLIIDANTGPILLAGVGAGITNIATVENQTVGATAALSADLAQLGSATTFNLIGAYGGNPVTVTDITDAMTVGYSGSALSDLTLTHLAPVVATDVINFEMNAAAPEAALTLTRLTVAAGLSAVNIDSTGAATDNVISNAAHIADSITVTGGTLLTLGDAANPYSHLGGTINALGVGATGGVTAFLDPTAGSATAMTFVAGPAGSTNVANIVSFGGSVIDFSHGGTDTVVFNAANPTAAHPINDTAGHNYNNVLGFGSTAAVDSINISLAGIGPLNHTNGGAVTAGEAINVFPFTTGTDVPANTVAHNFIEITPPVTSSAGESVLTAFAAAIGTSAANGIQVSAAGLNVLVSFYDTTTSEAVLVKATSHLVGAIDVINNASPIDVVGLIHESTTAYANLAANTHFVA